MSPQQPLRNAKNAENEKDGEMNVEKNDNDGGGGGENEQTKDETSWPLAIAERRICES